MRRFAERHPTLLFGLMALAFSLIFLPLHFLFPGAGDFAVSFTQLGPLAAVLFLAFLLPDNGFLKQIRSSFSLRKVTWDWTALTIGLPGVMIAISAMILTLTGLGMVSWSGNPVFYSLNLLGIVAGALAEEIGWRGYLLPAFQKRHSPLRSAVYTGIIWGVWHLNFTGGIAGFLLYTLTIVETSILMTWIFNRTKGNLSLMVIYHIFFNLFSRMFLWQRFRLELFAVESIVFGAVCLYIVHMDRKRFLVEQSTDA
ncbi:MAG TPA: type II CAAX endopeptidase family protein [Clostridiaceae bacterium]|nr:type II CAAX endopeptidase family protein [Clostridiaceae bacterium]